MESNKERDSIDELNQLIVQLEEAVQCSICLEQLKDPRILQCRHSFCLFCLHNLYRSKGNPNSVVCPNCKQETPVDITHGIEGLEKNKELAIISRISLQMSSFVEKGSSPISAKQTIEDHDSSIPETIGVPFRLNANQATQRLRTWFSSLKDCAVYEFPTQSLQMEGVFCPVYEFKITANSKFTVRVSMANHTFHNCTGDRGDQYTTVIYTSDQLDEEFRKQLQSFTVDVLQDEDLTNSIEEKKIRVLPRTIDKESARSDAQLLVQESEREASGASIMQRHRGACAISNLVCSTTCLRELVSQRLLPLYIGSYKTNEKTFKFVINGVTGDVYGQYPTSKVLSTLHSMKSFGKFLLSTVAILTFLWWLSIRQQEQNRHGGYHY